MNLDSNLRQMATDLQDTRLLARISGGDLVATETKYHLGCLVQYKNSIEVHKDAYIMKITVMIGTGIRRDCVLY